jgi:hypothetical protein
MSDFPEGSDGTCHIIVIQKLTMQWTCGHALVGGEREVTLTKPDYKGI